MRFIWTHLLLFETLMFSEWNLNEMLEVTVWEEIEQNMNLFDQRAISHLFWNVTSKYSRQKKLPVEFPQKSPKPFKFHKKTVYFRWSPKKENMFHFGTTYFWLSLNNLPKEMIFAFCVPLEKNSSGCQSDNSRLPNSFYHATSQCVLMIFIIFFRLWSHSSHLFCPNHLCSIVAKSVFASGSLFFEAEFS